MRFESFIQALDMGQCEDQLQRQALFDLALFFVMIDGEIADSETRFMQDWLNQIPWTSDVSKSEYYSTCMEKCQAALNDDDIEAFIAHRAKQLVDAGIKAQALKLANDIANVDGRLDEKEAHAIKLLTDMLAD